MPGVARSRSTRHNPTGATVTIASVPSCGVSEIRVLCVCTHNQTRSVLTAALAAHHLHEAGVPAVVRSAGIVGGGSPPTEETVRLLVARGLDVSSHRSRRLDDESTAAADLIVTAERDHVVQIVGRSPQLFSRTFTLPELVDRGERLGDVSVLPLSDWLRVLGGDRPAAFDYLDAPVGEIADPTARSRRDWTEAFATIDDLTYRLARLLARQVAVTGAAR